MYCKPFYFSHVTLEEAFEETKRLDALKQPKKQTLPKNSDGKCLIYLQNLYSKVSVM